MHKLMYFFFYFNVFASDLAPIGTRVSAYEITKINNFNVQNKCVPIYNKVLCIFVKTIF